MKARRFIPGQVWWLDIDTKGVDGCDHKIYPYLIMSANNRRVIALRIHTGASRASNWIREVGIDKDGNVQRVILDAPITIALVAVKAQNYDYTLEDEEFIPIVLEHYAAMAAQSDIDIFSHENVKKIIEFMSSHEDSMFAFGKYVPRPQKAIETEARENIVDDADADADDEDDVAIVKDIGATDYPDAYPDTYNNNNDSIDARIAAARERLAIADPDDAPYLAVEHAKLLQEKSDAEAAGLFSAALPVPVEKETAVFEPDPEKVPKGMKGTRKYVKLEDIIIPNQGMTSLEDIKEASRAFSGINGSRFKFALNDLMTKGVIKYTNNSCNCTLKKNINSYTSDKGYHKIPEEFHSSVYADACKFGISTTSIIWECSASTVRRICGIIT